MPSSTQSEYETYALEDDVRVVEELQQSGDFSAIHAALADDSLADEDVLKVVPRPLIRLAYGLRNPANVEKLKSVPGVGARLDNIAQFLHKEFSGLTRHRATTAYMTALAGRSYTVQEIASINHVQAWLGSPPSLFPAVRLVLSGPKDQVLFDHITGIDDLLFLVRGTTRAVADLLKDAAELHRRGLLMEIPQGFNATTNSIRESLEQVDRHLAELTATPNQSDAPSPPTASDPALTR